MNLILFGFKASGKTHFGKLLALNMNRPFIDLDDVVSELYAQKNTKHLRTNEIYKKIGGPAFRLLEKEAVKTLKNLDNAIIALGGGTVLDPENVELLLKIGAMVYLETSHETLRKRIFRDELPAFFNKDDPERSFLMMIHERKPIYESIPAQKINTETLDEAGVIAALRSILILEEPPNGF